MLAGDSVLAGVRPLTDSGPLWAAGDAAGLRAALARDGVLLLRGLLPAAAADAARLSLLGGLGKEVPHCFSGSPCEGRAAPGASAVGLLSRQHLAAAPVVRSVLEHPLLFSLADTLLPPAAGYADSGQQEVLTPAFKWARAVAPGEWTGCHLDRKYVDGAPDEALTFWLPLGEVPLELGGLLVARASHRLRSFSRLLAAYCAQSLGEDGAASGWLCPGAAGVGGVAGAQWLGSDVGSGDVVVLRLDVLHQTACNVSERLRTSCDTRWARRGAERDGRHRWRGEGEA